MRGSFPGSSAGEESTCIVGGPGSIPDLRRSPGERERLPAPVFLGFPGSSDSKESACNVGDLGSIPGLGRSPGGGHGNPLQCSCLDNHRGQRSLVGYSPRGCRESDTTERLSTAQGGELSDRSGVLHAASTPAPQQCTAPGAPSGTVNTTSPRLLLTPCSDNKQYVI